MTRRKKTGWGWVICLPLLFPGAVRAQDSAFASVVVEYVPGTGLPIDWINGLPFDDPTRALGPPTVDTTGDGSAAPPTAWLPVLPAYPAFRNSELVSIGSGGRLTLQFDHPVLDDPANPYGLDFILFGNAWQQLAPGPPWGLIDPATVTLSSFVVDEPGTVSVSADGSNWFSYTAGPFADTAPTLGRIYAPQDPDVTLGAWNRWWGAPANPTRPADPAMTPAALAGYSLADAAHAYGMSAGGTGFEIGGFALPPDPASGLKFIRFVRIDNGLGASTPEIDSVADVAPAPSLVLWLIEHFSWQERADETLSGMQADADQDGDPNLIEYLAGSDPREPDAQPAFSTAMQHAGGQDFLLVTWCVSMQKTDITARVEHTLDYTTWTTNGVEQVFEIATNEIDQVCTTAAIEMTAGPGAVRLVAEAITP